MHKGNYVFSTEAHPFSIETVRRGGHSSAGGGATGNRSGSNGSDEVSNGVGRDTQTLAKTTVEEKGQQQEQKNLEQGDKVHQAQTQRGWWHKVKVWYSRSRGRSRRLPKSQPSPNNAGSRDEDSRYSGVGDGVGDVDDYATWAAWRASAGERHHRLGPESWRDSKIVFWAQAREVRKSLSLFYLCLLHYFVLR